MPPPQSAGRAQVAMYGCVYTASWEGGFSWALMNDALKGNDEVVIILVPSLAGVANERI